MWVQPGDCDTDLELGRAWLWNGPVGGGREGLAYLSDYEGGLGGHIGLEGE